jgi:hypothetical protein
MPAGNAQPLRGDRAEDSRDKADRDQQHRHEDERLAESAAPLNSASTFVEWKEKRRRQKAEGGTSALDLLPSQF